ncbi:MAG TPA: glycosyltransferase family 87 protein [Candidatus Sulfotelmatobacter sp.]
MAFYVTAIWGANQPPGFSDLYAGWWGAHELLLHGRDPYSTAVAHEIQTVIYGAPLAPDSQDPTGIGGGFAYPLYAALLLWPSVYWSFGVAQRVFIGASILGTLFSLAIWLRLMRFGWSPIWLTASIFALGSFPALQGIKLQNPSLLAASGIAIAFFLLSSERLALAGAVFAIATFKPQFMILLIPWLAVWSTGDWRRRRPMVWGFLATMGLLAAVSEWLLPGWTRSFLKVVRAYHHYTYGHSLLDVWFTPAGGAVIATFVLTVVLVVGGRLRSKATDSPQFLRVTSLVLAATVVVIPTLAPHAQLLLLPGVLCLFRDRTSLSSSGALSRLVLAATWSLLAWPWISAFGLLLASTRYPTHQLLRYWEVPLYTSPLLPMAVLTGLGTLLTASPRRSDVYPEVTGFPTNM